jgi:hypothetical protein
MFDREKGAGEFFQYKDAPHPSLILKDLPVFSFRPPSSAFRYSIAFGTRIGYK